MGAKKKSPWLEEVSPFYVLPPIAAVLSVFIGLVLSDHAVVRAIYGGFNAGLIALGSYLATQLAVERIVESKASRKNDTSRSDVE